MRQRLEPTAVATSAACAASNTCREMPPINIWSANRRPGSLAGGEDLYFPIASSAALKFGKWRPPRNTPSTIPVPTTNYGRDRTIITPPATVDACPPFAPHQHTRNGREIPLRMSGFPGENPTRLPDGIIQAIHPPVKITVAPYMGDTERIVDTRTVNARMKLIEDRYDRTESGRRW